MSKKRMKKRGSPSGKPLSAIKVSDMFALFCDRQSMAEIARKCIVSETTVRKYRDREGWIKRRESISQKAMAKIERKAVTDQSRHVTLARALQQKGASRLLGLKDEDIDASEVRQFIKTGILLEREILGEGESIIQIRIKLPAELKDV